MCETVPPCACALQYFSVYSNEHLCLILLSACTTARGITFLPWILVVRYSNKVRETGYPV
jgi:hypothetical protein